jgi:hypothetical protein
VTIEELAFHRRLMERILRDRNPFSVGERSYSLAIARGPRDEATSDHLNFILRVIGRSEKIAIRVRPFELAREVASVIQQIAANLKAVIS